ncbi:MAG TPA: right-handed parallel beta-helix repeat-containing protein [Bacteroidales bacterium]|nr:right-handed parallel beta-helix repeat-containing protein [Bacteroidales bacterium]
MRYLNIIVFLFLFMFISTLAYSTSYYISPSGNDNNTGTIDSPFFTLNKAWSVVKAGDVIYARGGTYRFNSRQNLTGKNGTSSDTIKIWAYPGERPVFTKSASFETPSFPVSLIYVRADYVHIRGVEVAWFTQNSSAVWYGIAVQSSDHCTFERINSHHNGHGMGIRDECNHNLVLNCDFHHNLDPVTSYGNADGLAIAYQSSSVENIVRGCRMWNNSDDGLDLWDNNGNLVLENSWSWRNGYLGNGSAAGDGCGFKFGKTSTENGTAFKRTVRNTISVYNRSRGYMQNSANVRFNFYNNIAWKNPKGLVFSTYNLAHVFRNNIVFENDENWNGDYSKSVRDHNSNDPSPEASAADFMSIDTTGMSGKRKADGGLPDLNFMKLAAGSDLVDAGVNIGMAYNGKAPDLGAYEAGSGISAAPDAAQNTNVDTTHIDPAEKDQSGQISILPYPAKDHLTISNFNPGNEQAVLTIKDFAGNVCFEAKLENKTIMANIPVSLAPGFYVAQLKRGDAVQHVQKLVFVK